MLSADERRHTTKMRANGERIVEKVGDLAVEHEVALPRISVEEMKDDLTLARRLAPLAGGRSRGSRRRSRTRSSRRSRSAGDGGRGADILAVA
jgi:hypothetical protein